MNANTPVTIIMIEDDEGHARLIERNIRRSGVNNEIVPFTNDVHAVENGIGRIERGSSTALYDAIYLASQRLAQAPRVPSERRVVVLITDGENTVSHGSYQAALEQAQRAGAMIYSLIIVPVAADAKRRFRLRDRGPPAGGHSRPARSAPGAA